LSPWLMGKLVYFAAEQMVHCQVFNLPVIITP